MSTDPYVQKRFNNIKHVDDDRKLYRGLVLKNKMKILLISDPSTDISTAAMNVNIGYGHDPDDLPGLANLCSHTLPMGTEKYRAQDDYHKYVSQSNGQQNATTNLNSTNYYFTATPDKLEGGLDRFVEFFIAPLFNEDLIEKVVNTIDLEYKEKLTKDEWRFMALEKLSINPDHPYSKFGSGNKETLNEIPKENNINVKNRLVEFYEKYYSANIMSLCILGKDGLDDLENMVVKRFRNVKNKKVKHSEDFGRPYWKDEDFKTVLYYVPICDIKELHISFCFPKKLYKHRMPLEYIEHLFKHESEGSLSSVLKAKGWCHSLEVKDDRVDTSIHFFKVTFHLTEEGIDCVDDIVQIMFQYIKMLKEEGPMKWIYKEIQKMWDINNSYDENIHRLSYDDIIKIACQLQKYPMVDIFSEQRTWRPDLITELIKNYFTPQSIRIYVASKTYESTANETEKWFGIKYKKEKISEKAMDMWNNADRRADLYLPLENQFIPINFYVKPNISRFIPIIVKDTPFVRVWHKKDDEFYVPKATMIFHFVSPFAYMDPLSSNLTHMFVCLLRESLKKYTHLANLAGIKWQITDTKYGINLIIDGYGYNDKQRVLLERSMDQMINFKINPMWFKILKEYNIKYFENHDALHCDTENYLEMLLTEQHWLNDELLKSAADKYLSDDELELFIPKLFSQMHIECLMYGNVTEEEAIDIGELIQSKLQTGIKNWFYISVPLLQKQLVNYREIKLKNGCHVLFEKENKMLKTSSTIVYYETGLQSKYFHCYFTLSLLLNQIIEQPCFNFLRTTKELGYIVFSEIRMTNGTQYLKIFVRGDHPPQRVEEQIDSFMEYMFDHISVMSEEQFGKHKDSLNLYLHLTAPNTISSQGSLYWKEIESQNYNFDRVNIEKLYLQTITKKQLLQFFKENILSKLTRRKLSVHVMPTAMAVERNLPDTSRRITVTSSNNKIKKFDNLMSFKLSQSLYPLLEPIDENFVRKPYIRQ